MTTEELNALELSSFYSPAGTGELCVMDQTGDTRLIWSADNADEVDAARATFDKLTKKGYRAFAVNPDGEKGLALSAFDPRVGKMILMPPLVGG